MTATLREAVVTGGRDYHPTAEDALWLRAQLERWSIGRVLQGECRHRCDDPRCTRDSLDQWAARVARRLGLESTGFRPDRERYGVREAYLERNLAMLDREPAVVLAFPGGSGTGHTVAHARQRRIPVVVRVPCPAPDPPPEAA